MKYHQLMLVRKTRKLLYNNNNNNNETHKVPRDFAIQTDPLIPTRRPHLVIIKQTNKQTKKRICRFVDFAGRPQNEDKIKRKYRKIFGSWQRTKKL